MLFSVPVASQLLVRFTLYRIVHLLLLFKINRFALYLAPFQSTTTCSAFMQFCDFASSFFSVNNYILAMSKFVERIYPDIRKTLYEIDAVYG